MSDTPKTDAAFALLSAYLDECSFANLEYEWRRRVVRLKAHALASRDAMRELERENWRLRKESDFWVDLLVSNANSRFFSQEYTESSENSDA